MIVWKDVLAPGTWILRDGRRFVATAEDVSYYADGLKRMVQAGLHVPLAWEHQPDAVPLSRHDVMTDVARHTFGHVEDVSVDHEHKLWVASEVEDPDDVAQLKKTKYCSPWIEMRPWQDDTGREWPIGQILHIAATPTPINRAQSPFTSTKPIGMSAAFAAGEKVGLAFGTSDKPVRLSGAVREEDVAEDPSKAPAPDETPAAPAEPAEPAAPEEPAAPAEPEQPSDKEQLVKELLDLLVQDKMHLGDDTTPANFLDRLKVALTTKQAHDAEADGEPNPGDTELPPEGNSEGNTQEASMPSPVMMSAAQVSTLQKNHDGYKDKADKYAQRLVLDRRAQLKAQVEAIRPLIGDEEAKDLQADLTVISDAELLEPVALSSNGAGAACGFLKQIKRLKKLAKRQAFTAPGTASAEAVALSAAEPPEGVHEVGGETVGADTGSGKMDSHVLFKLSGGRAGKADPVSRNGAK